jgi:predicted nucleotidyltransferase
MTNNPDLAQQNATLFHFLIRTLQDEFGADLLGILATGSRIHGTPGPSSDLDAHIVIARHQRQRRNLVHAGVELELFINPPFQVRRYFADERGVDPHMWTFGRIIYDPRGTMAELQREARAIWEAGPPQIAERDRWMHRYAAADLLRDIMDVAPHDEVTAALILHKLVEQLLMTHARVYGHWLSKSKRRLNDLEQWDATAARLAREAVGTESLQTRIAAAAQLAAHVLEPLGGLMPLQWQTEWEALQP